MSTIFVNSSSEATNGASWTIISDFKSGTKKTKDGITYEVISQESKVASTLKRIGFIVLTILSLGTALISSTCRDICLRGKEFTEFAVPSTVLVSERKILKAPATPDHISLKDRAIAMKDKVVLTCNENSGEIAIGAAVALAMAVTVAVALIPIAKKIVEPIISNNPMTSLSQSLNPFMTPVSAFESKVVPQLSSTHDMSKLYKAGHFVTDIAKKNVKAVYQGIQADKDALINGIANSNICHFGSNVYQGLSMGSRKLKDGIENSRVVNLGSMVYHGIPVATSKAIDFGSKAHKAFSYADKEGDKIILECASALKNGLVNSRVVNLGSVLLKKTGQAAEKAGFFQENAAEINVGASIVSAANPLLDKFSGGIFKLGATLVKGTSNIAVKTSNFLQPGAPIVYEFGGNGSLCFPNLREYGTKISGPVVKIIDSVAKR